MAALPSNAVNLIETPAASLLWALRADDAEMFLRIISGRVAMRSAREYLSKREGPSSL